MLSDLCEIDTNSIESTFQSSHYSVIAIFTVSLLHLIVIVYLCLHVACVYAQADLAKQLYQAAESNDVTKMRTILQTSIGIINFQNDVSGAIDLLGFVGCFRAYDIL